MVLPRRRLRRTRKGVIEVRLPETERRVLATLVTQMRALLDDDADPALRRLYPTAYPDDAERDREYHALVRDDLRQRRVEHLQTLANTVEAETLTDEELMAWMQAVNEIRLVLGTKLDVSEDEDLEVVDNGEPEDAVRAVYVYLGWLLEQILQVAPR